MVGLIARRSYCRLDPCDGFDNTLGGRLMTREPVVVDTPCFYLLLIGAGHLLAALTSMQVS